VSAKRTIFTVGHSTLPLKEFESILLDNGIKQLADVRRFPGSRRYPHFNADALAKSLKRVGIAYLPMPALGGRRRPDPKSDLNSAWESPAFRGYADYMLTPEFRAALKELEMPARKLPTAIMCAEAVPWRCHRSLISDALIARSWRVLDLIGHSKPAEHKLTKFARVTGQRVTYPAKQLTL